MAESDIKRRYTDGSVDYVRLDHSYEDDVDLLSVAQWVWDTELLQWVRGTGGSSGTASVTYLDNRYAYDTNGNIEYIGQHLNLGAATDDLSWRVSKLSWSSGNVIQKQGPVSGSWDNRASLF